MQKKAGFPVVFTLCLLSFAAQAQTKLTLVLKRDTHKIDSVKISRFSDDKGLTIPYKDSLTVSFSSTYADLYSIDYYEKGAASLKWQGWLDTGSVKLKTHIKNGLVQDTVIGSSLPYKTKDFYQQLGDYRSRRDSSVVNDLMIKTYKENYTNPFSFEIGRMFYNYNKQGSARTLEMNALEEGQSKEIKKSVFYDMMLRDRFRNSEKQFISYFTKNILLDAGGQLVSKPFDWHKFTIVLMADPALPAAMEDFKTMNSKAAAFKPKDFNFMVVFTSKDISSWKSLLDKSSIPYFILQNQESFTAETIVYPRTKFFVIDGINRISGFYDEFSDVLQQFDMK